MQIQIFYNELNVATKLMLDAAAGGSLCSMQPNAAQIIIQEMTSNSYQWSSEKKMPGRVAETYKVEALTTLAAQVEAISKRLVGIQLLQQQPLIMS